MPFEALSPTAEISAGRIAALDSLQEGRRSVIVSTADSLMQKVMSGQLFKSAKLELSSGLALKREELVRQLELRGYRKSALVQEVGQIAVRGLVVDIFSPRYPKPIRVELMSGSVRSLRFFDVDSQRSIREIQRPVILPVREFFLGNNSAMSDSFVRAVKARASDLGIAQGAVSSLDCVGERGLALWPGLEHLQPLLPENVEPLFNYLPKDTLICCWGENEVKEEMEVFTQVLLEQANRATLEGRLFPEIPNAYLEPAEVSKAIVDKAVFRFESILSTTPSPDAVSYRQGDLGFSDNSGLQASLFHSRMSELPLTGLADYLKNTARKGNRVAIAARHLRRAERLDDLLSGYELQSEISSSSFADWLYAEPGFADSGSGSANVTILLGGCSQGFSSSTQRFALIDESEIFGQVPRVRAAASGKSRQDALAALSEITPGDFVVHSDHGIALYHGLKEMRVAGSISDCLCLEFRGSDKLYLPVENIGKIHKYIASEGAKPLLSQLGGGSWAKTKEKVKKDLMELAGRLVSLYARRTNARGFSFGAINSEDIRFAESFSYEETADQAKAIEEVLADMQKDKPMDRLVCGDVGYGKTEVAIRAAFKAVNAGKQVALLVPTTILADQHYATFKERLAGFGVNVACVSRFFSTEANKLVLSELAQGKVDVIIGTHRILQNDIAFKDLGIVIVDEEHRFGVLQKEKLKSLRHDVDYLALTATPIPRTLYMSMLNIRDLSVIETPPCDRQVVTTYLGLYDDTIVMEALQRELGRGGQVFFVHNKIETISGVARKIQEMVPRARVAFAHGKMKEVHLEEIMHRFVSGELDVLVTTTIVESGLDIPNANTIVITQAENFGLADLYQLRGRVGRSSKKAYAYFLLNKLRDLGPAAKKRLDALKSIDDLGVGFRLALQDMRIRGVGNLLGKDQSGKVSLVGFETYMKILSEAIAELEEETGVAEMSGGRKSLEAVVNQLDPEIKVGFSGHIPENYIPDVSERLLLYRRLVSLTPESDLRQIKDELSDRFGPIPKEVHSLLELMIFRSKIKQMLISQITFVEAKLRFVFHPMKKLKAENIAKVIASSSGRVSISPSMAITAKTDSPFSSPEDMFCFISSLVAEMSPEEVL